MKLVSGFLLLAVLWTIAPFAVHSQSFDVAAYKQYLESHKSITPAGVLHEYPTVLFRRNAPAVSPAYMDSVTQKFGLTTDELDLLGRNGFLVTERRSAGNLIELYDDVWQKDLPVFVTSDALLNALHLSYVNILQQTEKQVLKPRLSQLLAKLQEKIPALATKYQSNPGMTVSLADVEVYIETARRLLGENGTLYYASNESVIQDLLAKVSAQQPEMIALFSSTPRAYDFSQFTLRGHYEQHQELWGYFKAMMWLGRTEFMLAKPVQQGMPEQTPDDIRRQTIDAYVLQELYETTGAESSYNEVDGLLTFLVGESDNLTFRRLVELKSETGFSNAADLFNPTVLQNFQQILATKQYADQRINSQILMSDPANPEQSKPAAAFLLLGQRFIVDSYVFSNVVYDRILHDGEKVRRMLPSVHDVLFTLGNNASAQFLQDDLTNYSYGPNLTSLRYLIDGYDEGFWGASMYNRWLGAIKTLNPPESYEGLPDFMKTASWWQFKMNTQAASWAQLRHDNLLYAKQSYSSGITCSFPEGYVEPVPAFYDALMAYGRQGEQLFQTLDANVAAYFKNLTAVCDTLGVIARKELSADPLTDREKIFLQSMLRSDRGCGEMSYYGWYAKLIYSDKKDDFDMVVVDVHTAPTDESGNPVGWVKHAGNGLFNLCLAIAPSQNGGTTVYAGAAMSYCEYLTTNFTRLTDSEWRNEIQENGIPRPSWTYNFLADKDGNRYIPGPSLATAEPTAVQPVGRAISAFTPVLNPGYPNPLVFPDQALFSFSIRGGEENVRLEVFDMQGRLIRTLVNGDLPTGGYYARWDGKTASGEFVPSGRYSLRLATSEGSATQTLAVMR